MLTDFVRNEIVGNVRIYKNTEQMMNIGKLCVVTNNFCRWDQKKIKIPAVLDKVQSVTFYS